MSAAEARAMLQVGCAAVDITPPLAVGLLMSSVEGRWAPFDSVRLPLLARVLVLGIGSERVAIVSYDLLGLGEASVNGWERFKAELATSEAPADRIVVACTHSHTAPESVGITNLYQTEEYGEWLAEVKRKTRDAISDATSTMQSCTVRIGLSELTGFSLQRRISTPSGVVMSDSMQPIAPEHLDRGPVDHRVRSLLFHRADGSAAVTLVHAVCHPVHEMCMRHISPDFPGELCRALDAPGDHGMTIFLNGAAADINPTTVSCGTQAALLHGEALAKAVRASDLETLDLTPFRFVRRDVQLPARDIPIMTSRSRCTAHLSGFRLGSLAILFLPGEPFVETALAIERHSPFRQTIVVGFCETSVGYIPPPRVFEEGGYEKGPGKWSFLTPEAEKVVRATALEILNALENCPHEPVSSASDFSGRSQ